MTAELPAIVIDNGTGYTKMGYSGNLSGGPQFVIPTAISKPSAGSDFDYQTGHAALEVNAASHRLCWPVRHGQVEDWTLMEGFWQDCFFKYLRCDPSEHSLLLTEPPLNAPENREYTAEIMFETFNVPRMYIGVQAVLALAASWSDGNTVDNPLSGTVVDSGDGVTHIIPVVDGYAIGSAIKHIPLAGKEITLFIQQLLRDRNVFGGEAGHISPSDSMQIAKAIKEKFCYSAPDTAREFLKFDQDPGKYMKSLPWKDRNGRTVDIPVGHERFLAPEIFFNPDLGSVASHNTPLPTLIDAAIQECPIDCRRALYQNIVLSGGSTLFKDFDKRICRDITSIIAERLAYTANLKSINQTTPPKANVVSHFNQKYAVWAGGSLFASMPQFTTYCHSREDYEEYGPGICRQSRVFANLLS